MRNFKQTIINVTTSFLMLLFCYAAVSKILDFENFQIQLKTLLPLLMNTRFVALLFILSLFLIVLLLCITKWRRLGLVLSFGMMVSISIYIIYLINFHPNLPCTCLGFLEGKDWRVNLYFNLFCSLIAGLSLYFESMIARTSV